MKESYGEGVATHTGPESCAVVREGDGEALTRGRAGQVLSREIYAPRREPWSLWGADAVEEGGRLRLPCRHHKTRRDPARSESLRTHRHISHGNREIRRSPATDVAGRIGKSKDVGSRVDDAYERLVAIKVLRPPLEGVTLVQRFREERQI